MKKSYIGIITQRENDLYLVTFPDVPGCSATGSTFEQCYQQGLNALWFALRDIEINYQDRTDASLDDPYIYPSFSVDHYPMQPNQIPVFFTVEVKGQLIFDLHYETRDATLGIGGEHVYNVILYKEYTIREFIQTVKSDCRFRNETLFEFVAIDLSDNKPNYKNDDIPDHILNRKIDQVELHVQHRCKNNNLFNIYL